MGQGGAQPPAPPFPVDKFSMSAHTDDKKKALPDRKKASVDKKKEPDDKKKGLDDKKKGFIAYFPYISTIYGATKG